MASLFMDGILAVLLLATIIYAAMLNRRLQGLRGNREELEQLIRAFNESCARAEAGVRTLRTATDEATRLQQYLDRSQTLRDDLTFLIDRGASLADRLEGNVRSTRSDSAVRSVVPAPAPVARPAPVPVAASMPVAAAAPAGMEGARVEAGLGGGGGGSLADRLAERAAERLGQRGSAMRPTAAADPRAVGADAPRSKAERELLQALRTKR